MCWEWEGKLAGRDERAYFSYKGKLMLAYRVVYMLVHGDIPDDAIIKHKCDNPVCCNPYHLEPGTQAENMREMSARDRVGTPRAVVRAMFKLHEAGWTHQMIADLFEVARETVTKILNKKRKHYEEA